ncbi:hypothetical protein [Bacillus sp. B-jedd]|nr:hypothetical protein [Bacillus sp. B-jedd]
MVVRAVKEETLDATVNAIADGLISKAKISFWDTLPEQKNRAAEE